MDNRRDQDAMSRLHARIVAGRETMEMEHELIQRCIREGLVTQDELDKWARERLETARPMIEAAAKAARKVVEKAWEDSANG